MADVTDLLRQLRDKADLAVSAAVQSMVDDLKFAAPVGTPSATDSSYQPGQTRDSIDFEPVETGDRIAYRIYCPTDQGEYVEKGTDPHDIYGNPYLAFEWNGELVILNASRTPVHHPGTSPRPWFHPVTDRWNEYINNAFD